MNIKHIRITDFGTIQPEKSRIAVASDGDRITVTHIGGKAPRLTSQLMWKVIEAAEMSSAEALELSSQARVNPFKVVRREGMSGACDWKLVVRREDEMRDYPTKALVHESMNGKLNMGISKMWIGDLAEIAQTIENWESFRLSEPGQQEFIISSPPAWEELKNARDECAADADVAAMFILMNAHKSSEHWYYAQRAWYERKGDFPYTIASYVIAGGVISPEEIESVKNHPRPATWPEELEEHWRGQCAANAAMMAAANDNKETE